MCMYMYMWYMYGEKRKCYFILDSITVASLQINCGYAKTAIRELSASKKGISRKYIDIQKRVSEFKSCFAPPMYILSNGRHVYM